MKLIIGLSDPPTSAGVTTFHQRTEQKMPKSEHRKHNFDDKTGNRAK